jgi:hypothetical protein
MLFKRDTAILNRFGAFLAIVADETFGLGRVRLSIGKEFVAGPPLSGEIAIVGEAPFTPYLRFLRLGPEGEKNLLPFRDLADAFRRTLTMTDGFRPATPPFSDSATDRFAALIVPPSPPPRIQSIVAPSSGAGGRVALQIERRADGLFVWSGDLTLDAVGAAWNDEVALLEVTCSAVPSDSGAIVAALGRLCGHATRCELHCRDRRRWEEAMQPFTGRALPGPNIDWHFSIVDVGERRIEANAPGYSSDAIAEQLSARLDARVLCDLHHVLSACLRQDQAVDIGWLIEPTLKAQMSARWLTWHAELEQDAAKLRRFLVLLATHRDEIRQSADALVSVGPKTMRPHLVRAIVFALAFAVSSDETFSPTVDYPGNMRAPSATAHASGISWIDGRDIGPEVSTLRWSASVVLLSELRTSLEFLQRHDVRLDRLLEDAPHISDQGTAEQPFIFGCDHVFRNALEHGIDAVRLLIQAALRDRAATVEKQIEPKGKHDGQDVQ